MVMCGFIGQSAMYVEQGLDNSFICKKAASSSEAAAFCG
jgi:hypothetical protein